MKKRSNGTGDVEIGRGKKSGREVARGVRSCTSEVTPGDGGTLVTIPSNAGNEWTGMA